ncbi:hypothetical protein HHI36_010381 [Cryptolaemus montrouzieri]|uniref:Cyclin C-terminal domain-containing protein n=1 Tax=Cryptolaemus montrouzieri TaxID=559131 RepID=A0ABD2MIK2_9CUCU
MRSSSSLDGPRVLLKDYIDRIYNICCLLRVNSRPTSDVVLIQPALIQTTSSMIAAACLTSAIRGLKLPSSQQAVLDICSIVGIDIVALEILVRVIDQAVEKVVPRSPEAEPQEKMSTQGYESPQYGQPNTPTEVDNIYF